MPGTAVPDMSVPGMSVPDMVALDTVALDTAVLGLAVVEVEVDMLWFLLLLRRREVVLELVGVVGWELPHRK